MLLPCGLCSSLWYLWVTDYCLNFCFLSFDMMMFVLDFLVFLRKLKYGVSSYISDIDLKSSIQFSCV